MGVPPAKLHEKPITPAVLPPVTLANRRQDRRRCPFAVPVFRPCQQENGAVRFEAYVSEDRNQQSSSPDPGRRKSLVFVVAWIAHGQAATSDPTAAPIATDQPAATDSSVVVPLGSLQAENGFARTVSLGQATYDAPETLLRFGVASKTELRLTTPDYFGREGMISGFGDLAVGMKQQMGPRQVASTLRSSYRSASRRVARPSQAAAMIRLRSCPGRGPSHRTGR
ncbi:hypothetical protein SBA3_450002 [Candidatus Sulfopaludibacter sp. SbA3]|nr:hypothetical protein SBA3_450002 [Candidatus Sulfopaludibacter sp. SbA3]